MNPTEEPKPTEGDASDASNSRFAPKPAGFEAPAVETPVAAPQPSAPAETQPATSPFAAPATQPPATAPEAPATPVQPFNPVVPTPAAPAGVATGTQAVPPKKSKTGLIIGLIAGAVGLFVITVLAAALFILPALQLAEAQGVATNFFAAAEKKDSKQLELLSAPAERTPEDLKFMESMASKVGKGCKVDGNPSFSSKGDQQLAAIKAACNDGKQTWDFGLKKIDGKWYIDKLVVIGGDAAKTDEPAKNSNDAAPSTPQSTVAASCVQKSEAEEIKKFSSNNYRASGYIYSKLFIFEPDSAVFLADYASMQQADLDEYATWIKKYTAKKFTVSVVPKVQEGSLSNGGSTIASQRADYIKSQLVSRGVAASKIVIAPPLAESGDSELAQTAYRNVNVEIIGDESCR